MLEAEARLQTTQSPTETALLQTTQSPNERSSFADNTVTNCEDCQWGSVLNSDQINMKTVFSEYRHIAYDLSSKTETKSVLLVSDTYTSL